MANAGGVTSVRIRDPRRWAVTLGGLAVYGLGSRLWLPGLDPEAVTRMAVPVPSANLSIFAVGVRPILFGLAFVEMARVVFPPLARWAARRPGPLGVFMADGASLRPGACGQPGDGHCKGGRGARRPRAVTGPDVPPRCRRRDRRRDRLPDLARQGYDRTGRRRRPADPVRRAFRRASALRRRRRPRERRDGASARLGAAGVGRALRRGLGASDRGDPDRQAPAPGSTSGRR